MEGTPRSTPIQTRPQNINGEIKKMKLKIKIKKKVKIYKKRR